MAAGPADESESDREPEPAIRRISDDHNPDAHNRDVSEDGNVAGSLDADQPLEPQQIDLENAFFVLMGVFLVVGFLVLAILGL